MTVNSTAEKNLNKLGERYSWLTLKPMSMSKSKSKSKSNFDMSFYGKVGKFLFIAIVQGLFIFLSWLNVLFFICKAIYIVSKDYGAPKEIKDFRWKLKNQNLTFDELILELIKIKGLNKDDFEKIKAEMADFVKQRRETS